MARKKFIKLKTRMFQMGVCQSDLEPIIGRKKAYIDTRMNGRSPWNTAKMKAIGEYLEIPRSQWLNYFMEEDNPEMIMVSQRANLRRLRQELKAS